MIVMKDRDKIKLLDAHVVGESLHVGAFTNHVGLQPATACVTFLDQLWGDQVTAKPDELQDYEQQVINLVIKYIKETLQEMLSTIYIFWVCECAFE